jgi:hypothetical protein
VILVKDAGPAPVDSVNADLERLAQLAVRVLGEHVNDRDLCAVCGCAFPCESAVLAEHNTALL